MLVLSRKENETIVIDDHIRITVVHCGRGRVKLGIDAPGDVSILRAEIVRPEEQADGTPSCSAAGVNEILAHCAVPAGA